ncbi:hypothetical protein [Lacinutrix algicola]|uniref:hypothetical protein n=1 Tax=Lacinutrix algicola TaxID=342954 RepID=UPI0006E3FD0B|nr:hypothetical protein [Lacinutrix algicola]
MKLTLIFLTIITLSSCKTEKTKQFDANEKKTENEFNSETEKLENRLIGDWGIYVQVVNGLGINCNVCPRIVFNDSNFATLTLPSGENESYKWNSEKGILKIEFIGDNMSEHYLKNSEYKMNFEHQKEYLELTLSLSENEQYILRK